MLKLLCAGDLHLGRRSSRTQNDDVSISSSHTWLECVEYAIKNEVSAVLLAGDIIDESNKFFEAFGPLEKGIETLRKYNIPVIAVSGNHDWDSIKSFVNGLNLDNFHILGIDGKWDNYKISKDGNIIVSVWGKSFISKYQDNSPIQNLPSIQPEGVPIIGLLHTDVGAKNSVYAGVDRNELQNKGFNLWVTGHIHQPSFEDNILICGSLHALDPSEEGKRGCWIIEIDENNNITSKHIPLSSVEYHNVNIDLSQAQGIDNIRSIIAREIRDYTTKIIQKNINLKYAVYRISLVSRTPAYKDVNLAIKELDKEPISIHISDCTVVIDKIYNNTKPLLNLDEISQGVGVTAFLAKLILDIESGINSEEMLSLLSKTNDNVASLISQRNAEDFDFRQLDQDDLKEIICAKGYELLDSLIMQVKK
ncbi:MAG: DNA repair exonuclease [Armatimonadota bacterium]